MTVLIQTDGSLLMIVIHHQLLLTLHCNKQYVTTSCNDIPYPPSNMANLFKIRVTHVHGKQPFYLKILAHCYLLPLI